MVLKFRCNKNTATHIGELNINDVESTESYAFAIEALLHEYLPHVLNNQEGFYTHEMRVQINRIILTGVSPVPVIAKEPGS